MNDKQDTDTSEESETTDNTDTATAAETEADADEPMDEKTEINKLLDEGYTVKQIIELGFNRRTAYHYAKLRVKADNAPSSTPPARENTLAIRKERESVLPSGWNLMLPKSLMAI